MKRLSILLAGASLFASHVTAGSVSNVAGTLDTTVVDPSPALYPHFICAGGCNGGSGNGAVSQAGAWSIGVNNFPALQTVTGTVSVSGVATAANQPSLNLDGGSLEHVTNFPALQSVSGVVSVGNFPAIQPISGSIAVSNLPASQAVTGTVSVANFPSNQTVTGSVAVPGVATAANQPGLNVDGGELAHVTNWPASQSVAVSNLPTVQPVSGTISVGNLPTVQPVSGSAGTALTQGTGTSGPNSLNVYVGGGVGVGPPSSSAQTAVGFFEQTTPAGVPIDPTIPVTASSTNASGAVTAANTFQTLLAASTTRKGCAFQNTSSDVEYVDVADITTSATKARSYQVQPGSYWYCSQVSGLVISDVLNIAAPTSGDTFVLTSQ